MVLQEAKRVYEDWIRRKEEKLLQEEAERLEAIREAWFTEMYYPNKFLSFYLFEPGNDEPFIYM